MVAGMSAMPVTMQGENTAPDSRAAVTRAVAVTGRGLLWAHAWRGTLRRGWAFLFAWRGRREIPSGEGAGILKGQLNRSD
jgi:hypothetical protein